jgi:hypothetical protein
MARMTLADLVRAFLDGVNQGNNPQWQAAMDEVWSRKALAEYNLMLRIMPTYN